MVNAASITATVEAIDYDKRTVALKGPRGNVVELKVGPNVKNFKQIKVGDRVTTKYFESTAFDARKPDERPIAEEASAVASGCSRGSKAMAVLPWRIMLETENARGRHRPARFPDFHRGNHENRKADGPSL